MALISIIVPCWGVEKYLDQCIDSLINQTLKDVEIILVDDESPDNVPEMCDKWKEKDSRIKVIHKKNAGLGMACNSGLDVAIGEYVAFCDSDDWVELNTYEILYTKAKEYHADLVMTSFNYVNFDGMPLQKQSITYTEQTFRGQEIKELMKGAIASVPSSVDERQYQASAKVALYRNSIIKEQNLCFVSERIIPSEDLIFNLDYMANCNLIVTLQQKFYNYRFNPNSISHNVKKDAFLISKNLYLYLKEKVIGLQLGEDGVLRVQRMFIGTTRATVGKILKSSLCKAEKKQLISEICSDSILKDVERNYPTKNMPLKHRAFLFATTHNLQFLLCLMSKYMH